MLNLYVNKSLISPKLSYIPLLYPFLGPLFKDKVLFQKDVFIKYGFDPLYYQIVDNPKKSHLILLPHDYWTLRKFDPERLENLIKEAYEFKKKILIDATGDRTDDIRIDNALILRQSCYSENLNKNDIIIPGYSQDLLKDYFNGKLVLRYKQKIPSIGFAGWGKINFKKDRLLFIQSRVQSKVNVKSRGIFLRQIAIKNLMQDTNLRTNFIIRDSYSARTDTISLDPGVARKQFIQNIWENDYSLCIRGDGNYSVRFYETLSLGRIPVIVDTNVVLPLDKKIDYRSFCLFIPFDKMHSIGRFIRNFHASLTNSEFKEKQKLARGVFDKYLRIDHFTKYLVDEIKSRI